MKLAMLWIVFLVNDHQDLLICRRRDLKKRPFANIANGRFSNG